MKKRVVVWGTGNVGRPAIRAVISHQNLELVGVVVANPDKVGRDAGDIAGVDPVGVLATNQGHELLAQGVDAVVYTATADTRPQQAMADLLACLSAGVNVVSSAFYAFLYPPLTPSEMAKQVEAACKKGNSSLFVSGIDPGWVMDVLPIFLSAMVSDIEEVRVQEVFNYGLYDQPDVVRHVIGFGLPMDKIPPMLLDFSLRFVWEPMVRLIADGLGQAIESVEIEVERLPLQKTIDVPGMGVFEQGTQGAFRFEVRGICNGRPLIVLEHVTRIDDDCAPDWPYPPEGQGCHRVLIKGTPHLNVSVHGEDPVEPGPAGGGNASAACRLVNAIDAVYLAKAGIVSPLDLPLITGEPQVR